MGDILAELTRILLGLFAEYKVRATIESTHLDDLMWKLRSLDDARVKECIADDLVPHILRLAEKLETASDYDDERWTGSIQKCAGELKERIFRVKHKPETT